MSRETGLRLFVAADPPAGVREALAGWARCALGVSGMRLVAPPMLHVTLCFLGTTPVADVQDVARLALGCAQPVPDLGLGAPVWLPRRRPRLVAVSVTDASGALADLRAALGATLAGGLGVELDRRRFEPHITVARMSARSEHLTCAAGEPTPDLTFAAQALTIYRSRLTPAGAIYEALERVALA